MRPNKPGEGNGGGGGSSGPSTATVVGGVMVVVGGAVAVAGVVVPGPWTPVALGFGLVVVVVGGAVVLVGGSGCFVEGTPVLTADGLVPIESIRVGDMVYTLDLERGEPVAHRVLKTFRSRGAEIVELDFGKEMICCTPQHRFYKGQWIAAQELKVGDAVLNRQGQYIELKRVQLKKGVAQSVFNLSVEGIPNYFVGTSELLVHNLKKQPPSDDPPDDDSPD